MLLRPPRSTRTDTLCPDTTLLRSTNRIPACAGCGWTWEKARCDRPTLGAPARTRALSGQRPLQEARNVDYFFRTYRMGHCVCFPDDIVAQLHQMLARCLGACRIDDRIQRAVRQKDGGVLVGRMFFS